MYVGIISYSSIQRSFDTLQYYTGTQNGVLTIEVSIFQRFLIERSNRICIHTDSTQSCTYMVHIHRVEQTLLYLAEAPPGLQGRVDVSRRAPQGYIRMTTCQ